MSARHPIRPESAPAIQQNQERGLPIMNAQEGEIVAQVRTIEIAEIDVGERLRSVDPQWVEGLAGIMARDGQLTPIEVCWLEGGRFGLVTGGHRLAAAAYNGWNQIDAIIVSSDWAERRVREVSENLWRRGLDPIDRAEFVAELVQLSRARDGAVDKSAQKIAADARWGRKPLISDALNASVTITRAYGWSDEVAKRLGVSVETVKKDLFLHRLLSPQVRAALAGLPVYRNAAALRTLARLSPEGQLQIAQMLRDGTIRTVGEGVATLEQRPPRAASDKRLSAIKGALARMGNAERREAFQDMAKDYLPLMRAAVRWAEGQDA